MEQKNDDLEVEDIEEIVETKDEDDNDTTDWKAEALKKHGIAKRYRTKLEKVKKDIEDGVFVKVPIKKESEATPEKKEFDYAELAYLTSKGITDEEMQFVWDTIKNTGKSLREIIGATWFQTELKEKREAQVSKNAIPSGSSRSSSSARDSVEYWITKGELPPIDQPELRQKVVNARIEAERKKSQFTDTPVV